MLQAAIRIVTTPGYYGSNYLFKASGAATDSFTWPASVAAAGKYRVYARWAGTIGSIVPDASFTVHHAGGTTTVVANQKQNQGAWNLLGSYELDPVAGHKVVLAGNAAAGLNLVADAIRYVRIGDSLSVQADAVRFVPNNAESLLYVHADRLGTAQRITDQAGAVVWDAVYLPFGTAHSITGAVTYNQRFPGQYFDAESGLHYNYWRDYDPRIGRYLQADPIGLEGGVNRFLYALGNPIGLEDPSGQVVPLLAALGRLAAPHAGRVAAGALAALSLNDLFGDLDDEENCVRPSPSAQDLLLAAAGFLPGLNASKIGHFFRKAAGHVNPSTPSSQQRFMNLFEKVAANPANRNNAVTSPGSQAAGNVGYSQNFRNGQVWVQTRNGRIVSGGVNRSGGYR